MARGRRKVVANDYDSMLTNAIKELEELESEYKNYVETQRAKIKEKKIEIKKLEKAKEQYDTQLAEQKKQEEIQEAARLIAESGKSLDEIKKFLEK